jgi:hypothetical protein
LPAIVDQEGAMVTLTPKNKMKLKPGKPRSFIVSGKTGTPAEPNPGTFFLNGAACALR